MWTLDAIHLVRIFYLQTSVLYKNKGIQITGKYIYNRFNEVVNKKIKKKTSIDIKLPTTLNREEFTILKNTINKTPHLVNYDNTFILKNIILYFKLFLTVLGDFYNKLFWLKIRVESFRPGNFFVNKRRLSRSPGLVRAGEVHFVQPILVSEK